MVCAMLFFMNVKLMFCDDAVHCALYLKNRCLFHALDNHKTSYEMWYICIPLVRHLTIFGSTCYALFPMEQRNELSTRNRKYIFLGYLDTIKSCKLYDKVHKKFLFARDAIFLECLKIDIIIKRQLDHLDNFNFGKHYIEVD